MKKSTKIVAGSLLSIVMCSSLITGATMALFTSESTTDISVKSGKVDVSASIALVGGSSLDAVTGTVVDNDGAITVNGVAVDNVAYYDLTEKSAQYSGYYQKNDIPVTDNAINFTNGGQATLVNGNKVTLDRITPGDSVNLAITVTNNSNVTVKYRTVITCEGDPYLFAGLDYTVGGTDFNQVVSYCSEWQTLTAPSDGSADVETVDISLALPLDRGREYQNRSTSISYVVEAVQGNGATTSTAETKKIDYISGQDNVVKEQSSATYHLTVDKTQTSTYTDGSNFTLSVPAEAIASDANSLTLSITDAESVYNDEGFAITSEQSAQTINISLDGISSENTTPITVTYYVGEGLSNVRVYHYGTQITDSVSYDATKGYVTFTTTSFSPFTFVYDKVNTPSSGVTNEVTDYYIYSVADLQAFANSVNAGTSYAGKTVKLMRNIDLSSIKNWTPIGSDENHLFTGTFDGNNKTISNLNINDSSLEFARLFGYIQYATLENINLVNANVKALSVAGTVMGYGHSGVTVTNCHVSGVIKVESNYKSGGFAGGTYGTYTNCSVIATPNSGSYVKGTFLGYKGNTVNGVVLNDDYEGDNVGGFVGHMGELNKNKEYATLGYNYNVVYTNCKVANLSVEGTRKVGGMFGILNTYCGATDVSVENVSVSTNADSDYLANKFTGIQVGGIVGTYFNNSAIAGTISNSTVYGLIEGQTGAVYGGPRGSGNIFTDNVTVDNVSVDYIIKNATKNNTAEVVKCTYDYIEVDSARGLLLANKLYTTAVNNRSAENVFSAGILYGSGDTFATIKLTKDIDLSGYDWNSIYAIGLKIDGNNHKISNVNCVQGTSGKAGFFSYFGSAKVVDLTLENVTASGCQVGILAGQVDGSVYNEVSNLTIAGTNKVTWAQNTTSDYVEDWGGIGVVFGEMNSTSGVEFDVKLADGATVTIDRTALEATNCEIQSTDLIWGYTVKNNEEDINFFTNATTLNWANEGAGTITYKNYDGTTTTKTYSKS